MTVTAEHLYDGGVKAVEILGEAFQSLTGRVVPYDTPTDVGWFVETFERGAFTGSLVTQPNVPLLLFHDNRSFPIGHAVAWDDRPDGLHGQFKLNMTAVAQQAAQLARDDDLTGMSVGFGPVRSTWTYAAEWSPDLGPDHLDRVVRHEARLLEVSLTPTPAYVGAHVYAVEADAVDGRAAPYRRNAELWLRQYRRHTPTLDANGR
jgi:HK97 family phage prohead protease